MYPTLILRKFLIKKFGRLFAVFNRQTKTDNTQQMNHEPHQNKLHLQHGTATVSKQLNI